MYNFANKLVPYFFLICEIFQKFVKVGNTEAFKEKSVMFDALLSCKISLEKMVQFLYLSLLIVRLLKNHILRLVNAIITNLC